MSDPTAPAWPVVLVGGEGRVAALRGELVRAGRGVATQRPGTTGARVVVVGVGDGDEAVVLATATTDVAALVLVDACLSADCIELLGESAQLPVLTVVDPERREILEAAIDGHLAGTHEQSDLLSGTLDAATRARAIDSWLRAVEQADASTTELTFDSADGWTLHADLALPRREHPVPGVVLVHSGRSDRSIYTRLVRLLVAEGVAVLNVDFRGRGASIGRGRFVDLPRDEQAAAWRDVAAALDVLAAHPAVDATRLGALGIAHGAGYAAAGCTGDPRVKGLVLLTGFHTADERVRAWLVSGAVDVLYVTGTPHRVTTEAMRELHLQTRSRRSRFVELPEGLLGYQLFDLHRDLEPTIAGWLAEVLHGE